MILLFRIISDEDQEFFRDLVIDGSDTFLEFPPGPSGKPGL